MINNYMFGIALNNHPTHSWVRLFKTSKLFSCFVIKYMMEHDKNSDKIFQPSLSIYYNKDHLHLLEHLKYWIINIYASTICKHLPYCTLGRKKLSLGCGGSRGGSGVSLEPPPRLPYEIKYFGLSETKIFHFHRILKKNEIKSAKRTPTPLFTWTHFPEILDQPVQQC